ncbi:hypothetical protein [Nocardia neocaledoniensis]|uniref:hypothetical protein n=1 Tax=Nocardia neocaledoniensis TaxID=236511 RepID=UPI002458A235|nr:hypothetical protein [Nocardia neocaledoniensis]
MTDTTTTVDPARVFDDYETTQEMRYTWRRGLAAATKTAADLREQRTRLAALRVQACTPAALPSADPADWFEPPVVPGFDFAVPDIGALYDALLAHYQLMIYRYDEAAGELATALHELDAPFDTPSCTELQGSLAHDYSPDEVAAVLRRLGNLTGMHLVCVWEYLDDTGAGGHSEFYIRSVGGDTLFRLAGDLLAWLTTPADDPAAPATPGKPIEWVGADTGTDPRTLLDLTLLRGLVDTRSYAVDDNRT